MTLIMAWVILVSATIGAAALVAEAILRSRRRAARGAWVASLAGIVVATAFAMLVPGRGAPRAPARTDSLVAMPAPTTPAMQTLSWVDRSATIARESVAVGDRILPPAWLLASALLLSVLGIAHVRLSRERNLARPIRLQDHRVFVTESLGPAVAGVREPVVLVPRWVLALDHGSQRLLLAHEAEHVRAHDSRVLSAGAVLAALVPWNPVLWWLVRRLRLAVEQDCDRRVLDANPGVRPYADLLLVAAGSSRFHARVLAAHFGEHSSDLERRIHAMTDSRLHWRTFTLTAACTALLVAAACEAPRPDPLAPRSGKGAPVPDASSGRAVVWQESQVEKSVAAAEGSQHPRYPAVLREAGVEGEVLVKFVVDERGLADPATLEVIRSTHELFSQAVRDGLAAMRFTPAELGGNKVKQWVEQPFTFRIAGAASGVVEREVAKVPQPVDAHRSPLAFSIDRSASALRGPGNAVVYSSTGAEVARYSVEGQLKEVRADDVASMEVVRIRPCPSGELACPTTVHIRLKPGREQAYRRK